MITRRMLLAGMTVYPVLSAPAFAAPSKIGILFFGAGWCSYCHQAASILHQLRLAGQIEIFAVSLDGQPLGVIEDIVPDDGRAERLGIVGVPQTFMFDPRTKTPVPVISGFPGAAPYVAALRRVAGHIIEGAG